ncbi:MAG: hypothetical protein GTN62_03180 [Gemmatimonadales bacterium]|nr:hypothetical protein [Gemmatimonadales bacterium]NIN49103.1 hypothetical protein [Gemmatimonadales bacterium]NIP06567.1 hypothetical protein [Gemmatimonadales bacterium]NIR00264.1 hypothetical protein [Gemmatimonadales bacterium]NIS64597.1 hypothetical protein [Gemmatimonadales bacterium]
MTPARRRFLWVALGTLLLPSTALGQSPGVLLSEGIAAYNDLEFVAAARIFRRALEEGGEPPLTAEERERALMYLGAAELLRGARNEAVSAFRRMVLSNPRYRPDELVFPPRITRVFEEVLQTTKVVDVEVPPRRTMIAGTGTLTIRVYASSPHQIVATILDQAGDTTQTLHAAEITDSAVISWSGLDRSSRPVSPGQYRLEVASMVSPGTALRSVRIPLDVRLAPLGALAEPEPLPDSLLLPERRPAGHGLKLLIPGAVIGGALMLPAIYQEDSERRGARLVIGGVVTLGGVIGFLSQKPGRAIPQNIAHNDSLRADWRRRVADVERENARRSAATRLSIRAGEPQRIGGG